MIDLPPPPWVTVSWRPNPTYTVNPYTAVHPLDHRQLWSIRTVWTTLPYTKAWPPNLAKPAVRRPTASQSVQFYYRSRHRQL